MLKNATILGLAMLLSCQMLMAQVDRPLEVADQHLQTNYDNLGLTARDVANYQVSSKVVTKHNKLTHVYLQQSHLDIPVHNAILNLNILADGRMLSVGNRFVPDLSNKVNASEAGITPAQAVTAVQTYFGLPIDGGLKLVEQISPREFVFDHNGLALEPIKVSLMYQPRNEQVRLVWNVDYYETTANHWWMARVDALTGEMLDYNDQVVHCEFDHPVHEECPEDQVSVPTAFSFLTGPGDEGSYRAFPLYTESPNHGPRELLVDPADEVASPFGWHDVDGEEGHEYTITRGNNVHAYHDIFSQNESVGGEPDGGDSLCFDFPLDLSLGRPYSQLDAATTNLFYWNNLIHDVMYKYGFDEESGNFQVNNYGRGGDDGDHVRAEALDGSNTNNANFATPADGGRPRMQMFLWGGSLPSFPPPSLEVTAPESVQGSYEFIQGAFGADLPAGSPEVEVVLVSDTIGVSSDACEPIINGADLFGKVAMLDRGDCEFGAKALAAQEAGAVAVIVCNNIGAAIFEMTGGDAGGQVNIPAIMISLQDCNELKLAMPGVMIQLEGAVADVPLPGPSGRDSDFDNGVIVHEYGHGISNRLTAGPNQAGCLSTNQQPEQAGEGWSDFFALVMTTTSADFAEEARGIGTYADGEPITGGGIRPYPYSRDMTIDPHTYADVATAAIPHGVGSVWCVMIWDMYWNLVDEYGFDDDLYNGTGGNNIAIQLVMDGLKLQPCNPGFIEARDAILEADEVNNGGVNRCLIWETFARRGLGVSADVGVEAFDKPDTCPPAYRVTKTAVAEAFAGDIITYQLDIVNGRTNGITDAIVLDQLPEGTTLVDGSSDCDITVEDGFLVISLGDAASGQEFACTYQLQTDDASFTYPAFEDMISGAGNWDFLSSVSDITWQLRLNNTNTGLLSFFARSVEEVSDQLLVMEEPVFLDGLNPGLVFYHQYSTEVDTDGGVVEISINGGADWEDVGADNFIENGYNSELASGSGNPLSGRPAFSGASGGEFLRSVVDLTAYAGETVLIRFRFGSNDSNAREGWYVDDISLMGNLVTVTNTACTDNGGEELCSSVTTILNGIIESTENLVQDLPLSLFPNPTAGQFVLSLPQPMTKRVDVQIRSVEGRLLESFQYDNFYREALDMSYLPAGVYILQFRTDEGLTTRRLIVE
ncbi:T9SS-dependent M36 family metallopeptidase [Lewinella cohaerens]|uniref:T9SS-dependent M36 family metallopeptidase n=1 Tax=Lewinella cohaerens TaxID=70995 RepID=UPI0003A85CC6|nr:T9SS-dependent M36 family metallopeptidase [Lewinella cohaerens]